MCDQSVVNTGGSENNSHEFLLCWEGDLIVDRQFGNFVSQYATHHHTAKHQYRNVAKENTPYHATD
jgi:hypothetical protein